MFLSGISVENKRVMPYLDVVPFVIITTLPEQPVRYDIVNIEFIQYRVRILGA
jgi:hypothetical protein